MSAWEEISRAIDGEWIAQQATALVEIPSVTLEEAQVCSYFEEQLRGLGLQLAVRMEHEREPFETPPDDPAVQAAARVQVGGNNRLVVAAGGSFRPGSRAPSGRREPALIHAPLN